MLKLALIEKHNKIQADIDRKKALEDESFNLEQAEEARADRELTANIKAAEVYKENLKNAPEKLK
jgi:hypothetical protein